MASNSDEARWLSAAYYQFTQHWSGSWVEPNGESILASTSELDLAAMTQELAHEPGFGYSLEQFTQAEIIAAVTCARDTAIALRDTTFKPFAGSDIRFYDDLRNNQIKIDIDRGLATEEVLGILRAPAAPVPVLFNFVTVTTIVDDVVLPAAG